MDTNDRKISLKMKNKGQLSIQKDIKYGKITMLNKLIYGKITMLNK